MWMICVSPAVAGHCAMFLSSEKPVPAYLPVRQHSEGRVFQRIAEFSAVSAI
ncbi:hypothetical protein KCP76_25010 [Salmonella enterica subsp. enterica serovar Weltevreden]|nr:hypothetical protein KCP76_25010 [Salmonella enterica subsp. enterica serovar Weltevreden]